MTALPALDYADPAYATAGCHALWQETHLQDDVVAGHVLGKTYLTRTLVQL